MKKVFIAVIFAASFALLSNEISQAKSLEAFSFSGTIFDESDTKDPTFPKLGDKFIGQLSYLFDPLLEPSDPRGVYQPDIYFYLRFKDFSLWGGSHYVFDFGPAGEYLDFIGWGQCSTFQYEDIYIQIDKTGGSIDILPLSNYSIVGNIVGSMDNVCYISIPLESQPVPEPGTMLLLGIGLVGVVGSRMRTKKK